MVAWKDISSYSRGEERIPKSFEARVGGLRLVVTRHRNYPGQWLTHAEPLVFDTPFDVKTAEEAQTALIELVRTKLNQALTALAD